MIYVYTIHLRVVHARQQAEGAALGPEGRVARRPAATEVLEEHPVFLLPEEHPAGVRVPVCEAAAPTCQPLYNYIRYVI